MAKSEFTLFEVGPRDGLQNEKTSVKLENKIWFIRQLIAAGVRNLELGAFVREDRVPQMADTATLYEKVCRGQLNLKRARAWALVPNMKGLLRAIEAGATDFAVFTAATDRFTRANIGMSVNESLTEFRNMMTYAKLVDAKKFKFRGYVSTAFGCPFEGKVAPKKTLRVVDALGDLGVEQISIGDTIGVATPDQMDLVIKPALKSWGRKKIAGHFHDTRGTALTNALRSIELGVTTLDSSAGGLGGCPFAPGASGNLATEDLLYMLNGFGIRTGIDLEKIAKISLKFAKMRKAPLRSRFLQAYASSCKTL